MKRVHRDGGFWLCFVINLLFQFEWVVLAAIALVLHFAINLPLFLFWGLLALWVIITFIITAVLSWAASDAPPPPKTKNVNPYSKTTESFLSGDTDEKK